MFSRVLLERTQYLVRNRSIAHTYDKIAVETGLKKRWIEAFAQGKIKTPDVCRVETLYNFLNDTPLTLGK